MLSQIGVVNATPGEIARPNFRTFGAYTVRANGYLNVFVLVL